MGRTLLALAAGLAASCYNPTLQDCLVGCEASSGACPSGLVCGAQARCVADMATTCALDARSEAAIDAPGNGTHCPTAPEGATCGPGSALTPVAAPCLAVCPNAVTQPTAAGGSDAGWTLAHATDAATATKLRASGGAGAWIGLHRVGSGSDAFGWTDGAAYTTEDWAAGNPSQDGATKACVVATSAGWVSAACTETHPFFVQHASVP